ncbi:SAF domain-containing protein [Actinokineospora sp.]|uniref:SAF domain-containing protein n=1 Tax=Actinokineospora sp. TaxID=1872133 RepID=UPI003D6A9531
MPRFVTRSLTLRRSIAAVLVLLAAVLWLHPVADRTAPMLVAARALAPGVDLSTSDVRVVRAPPEVVPPAAFTEPAAIAGRVLAGAAGEGEPITEARLVGPSAVGPGFAAVPVRLSDPAVAELVRPGSRVDIVSTDKRGGEAVVLARDATVVTVRRDDQVNGGRRGSLLLIALARDSAARVASSSLERPVTVTLR